jgi:hypothetical protein
MDILKELYVEERVREFVINLLTKTNHSVTEIAALAEVPLDFVKEVKRSLKKRVK